MKKNPAPPRPHFVHRRDQTLAAGLLVAAALALQTSCGKGVTQSAASLRELSESGPATTPAAAESTPNSPAPSATASLYDQVTAILRANCASCHGANQTSQGGLSDITNLRALIDAKIVIPGDAAKSKLYTRIASTTTAGRMPPPPAAPLSAKDAETIKSWIDSGAPLAEIASPSGRAPLDVARDIIAAARADLATLTTAEQADVRYFTSWPLWNTAANEDVITDLNQGLAKFINSVSTTRVLFKPTAIGTTGALFRVTLKSMGWSKSIWDIATTGESYFRIAPDAAELRALLGDDVPIVRIDEFIMANAIAPRYYEIQGNKMRLDDFLTQDLLRTSLAGLYDEVVAGTSLVKRLGFNNSQIADSARVIERHAKAGTLTFWMSSEFDSTAAAGTPNPDQDPFRMPLGPQALATAAQSAGISAPAGGFPAYRALGHEVIYEKPNGMLGFFVSLGDGTRLDEAPTGVRDSANISARVAVGASCMRCHYDGVIEKADQIVASFDKSTLPTDLRTLFQSMYVSEAKTEFGSDRSRYQQNLKNIGVDPEREDPVHRVRNSFLNPVSRAEVAALLKVPEAELNDTLQSLPKEVSAAWTPLTAPGGTVQRSIVTQHLEAALRSLAGLDGAPAGTDNLNKDEPTPQPNESLIDLLRKRR